MNFGTWMKFNRPNIEEGSEMWSAMLQIWEIEYRPEQDERMMEFKDYMKEHRADIKPGSGLYHGHEYTWYAARKGNKEDGRTLTEGEFDEAVGHITSFYQSKRAKLKKQLTHWIGKFSIIKQENNVLRRRLIAAETKVCCYEHIGYSKELTKDALRDAVKKVEKSLHTKEPIQC